MHNLPFIWQSNFRATNYYDWGSYIMVFCLLLFVFNYSYQNQRFAAMLRLPISDKYLRVFEEQPLSSIFNGSSFLLKIISYSLVGFFILLKFNPHLVNSFVLFLQVFTVLIVYYLSKILIEKIVFNIFDIEHLFEKILYTRFSYSNAIGILILPVNFFLYFNFNSPDYVFYIYLGFIALTILFNYFISILQFFKLLLTHNIYFILYICALEIAPLVFIYHMVTTSTFFK